MLGGRAETGYFESHDPCDGASYAGWLGIVGMQGAVNCRVGAGFGWVLGSGAHRLKAASSCRLSGQSQVVSSWVLVRITDRCGRRPRTIDFIMKHSFLRNLSRVALGVVGLWSASGVLSAQSARVAAGSVVFTPDAAKKELAVGFRLVDDVAVTSVATLAPGRDEGVSTTWEAWDGEKAPACAWMIVVDTSNPARAATVAKGVEFVGEFIDGLPAQDQVAVFSLARDLTEATNFGSSAADVAKGLGGIKPAGDASLTTLIHTNLREGLGKLVEREEPRKALLLLTDGKDETPGGAAAQEIEKTKLIDAAKKAGAVIHTLGYAEKADDQVFFAGLKEISGQTDGLFRAAALDDKALPEGTGEILNGVMHGAGTARIDLSKLSEPSELRITVKTASGSEAVLEVPKEQVETALKEPEAPETVAPVDKPEDPKVAETAPEDAENQDAAPPAEVVPGESAAKETGVPPWVWAVVGLVLIILTAALLMVKASRKRAAEEAYAAEEARRIEEERMAQETRLADEARRAADLTKKAEAAPLAWLEMCDAQQTRHPIRMASLKIGRGQHNDFVLRNDSVSGNHCVLNSNRDGEWSITDLNSGNGVVVNGQTVVQGAVSHGDVIELGELKMRFLLRA